MSNPLQDDGNDQGEEDVVEALERPSKTRQVCKGCKRPRSVCVCHVLPSEKIRTSNTTIVILQHPHELRQRLSTVSFLHHCIHPDSLHIVVGRRLQHGSSPLLDALVSSSSQWNHDVQLIVLFPSQESQNLTAFNSQKEHDGVGKNTKSVLVVVDGTWKHATEMLKASQGFLASLNAVRVCLPNDPREEGPWTGESDLLVRKEPFQGCVSTMEAVARSLGILDSQFIEDSLLDVLRAMAGFQSQHLLMKPQQPPRPKLHKKNKYHSQPINEKMSNLVIE